MEQLEIGEHVDLDSGLTIRRSMEDEYLVKVLEEDTSIILYEEEIQNLAQLAGFIGLPLEQSEW